MSWMTSRTATYWHDTLMTSLPWQKIYPADDTETVGFNIDM